MQKYSLHLFNRFYLAAQEGQEAQAHTHTHELRMLLFMTLHERNNIFIINIIHFVKRCVEAARIRECLPTFPCRP